MNSLRPGPLKTCRIDANASCANNDAVFKLTVLANVNSRSRSLYAIARPYALCRLSSVTFVRPTQAVEIFVNISTAFGTLVILDIRRKFYGDRPRGTPPPGELNTRGVVKYGDLGPIDGYISETVQDRR